MVFIKMMLFNRAIFIGIDPTAGKRPNVYAALNSELHLAALNKGDLNEVLAFVAGHQQAVVAVCAPRRPSLGVMERPEVREGLSPPPRPGRWTKFRLAEYLLRQRRISTHLTPSAEHRCPRWMQTGFQLYHHLENLGFQAYPNPESSRQYLETYPHACFTVLLGWSPLSKNSLEGRLQRQLILYEKGINIPDPMRFFEEITRYRLLRGILPEENLYSPGELDALVSAYTAWMAATHPEQVAVLGHPEEGQIVLPATELKTRY